MMGNETKQTRRGPINSRGQAESAAACATNSRNRMGKLPWKVSGMGGGLEAWHKKRAFLDKQEVERAREGRVEGKQHFCG